MYVDVLSYLEDLEKTLGPDSNSYKVAAQAYKDHPHLRAWLDHLGCTRLCSVDVNQFVDRIELTHRTEQGGSLEIMPFIDDKGVKVYSDPPIFIVGHRNSNGFGEIPLADWKEILEDSQISTEVQRKVKWYMGAHAPVDYNEQ